MNTIHKSGREVEFLESIHHGVLLIDQEGYITFLNSASEMIFGYEKEEVIGKHVKLFLNEEVWIEVKKLIHNQEKQLPVKGKWYCCHKKGDKVWVDIRLNKMINPANSEMQIVATVCDIHALKTIERELEESRARNKAILESSADGIVTIDEKGIINSFNKAAQEIFGYTEDEVLGRNVKMLMPLPYSDKHDSYMNNYLKTGEKKIIGKGREVQGLKKDGTVFPIDLTVSEVKWNNNRLFSGIIKDITNRKILEKRVLEISDEERKRIGQDLHDGLGQMLTGIRMISENLARKLKANSVPGAEEVAEIAKMTGEADEYARSLTHGMIEVDLEKNGLDAALQNLCRRNKKLFNVECVYQTDGKVIIEKHTIALNLYRIAQEAIHNAVKHGEADLVTVRLSNTGKHTSLIITDNGKGFPDGSDPVHEGFDTGMGIQIMKYRAGLLGGIFEIVRSDDEKTHVRCLIPNDLLQF
ncbi:MAG: PAS domain S-box protein [Balneolaceae bacterium]